MCIRWDYDIGVNKELLSSGSAAQLAVKLASPSAFGL